MSLEWERKRAASLETEASKARKLEIIFGAWWRHYALPSEFRWTLYSERPECPYCGLGLGFLSPDDSVPIDDASQVHMEHMDPLFHGGEESIRNTIYVCAACNIAKGRKLFLDWLEELPEDCRELSRAIYTDKHGHPPESFVRRKRTPRLTRVQIELQLAESVLKTLYPTPIVSGPPKSTRPQKL